MSRQGERRRCPDLVSCPCSRSSQSGKGNFFMHENTHIHVNVHTGPEGYAYNQGWGTGGLSTFFQRGYVPVKEVPSF